jgi:hypothetical protein
VGPEKVQAQQSAAKVDDRIHGADFVQIDLPRGSSMGCTLRFAEQDKCLFGALPHLGRQAIRATNNV